MNFDIMNREEEDMNYSALIVAAGSGTRMKLGYNKAYYRLDERTILEHTMDIFLSDPDCSEVVIVTDSEMFRKEIPGRIPGRVVLVSGGSSREEFQDRAACALHGSCEKRRISGNR